MTVNNVTRLDYQGKEIIIIATAHVSKQSVELVKQVVEEEKPDSVCIELDDARYRNIVDPKIWESTDIIKVIKENRTGFLLANLALSSYQKRMAKKLGTTVGGEMLQGIESANVVGANLVLADRDIQITFLRTWRKLSLWEKAKLIVGLIFSFDDDEKEITEDDLMSLMQSDVLETAMIGIHKQFPKIGTVLINERDQYLASKIKSAPGRKIVAVLGGAHVPGVKSEVYKEKNIDDISVIPEKSKFSNIIGWVIPVCFIMFIVYAFATNLQTGLQQLSTWVLWTGILSALFTAIALGHPLSILTSFIVAPLTTLHPLLACGWFTGLVEATLKKPTVQDIHNMSTDLFSIKGFLHNRFLRIILVVTMANVGASIGTIAAGTGIIRNLF